jgi:hypothetical protein
MELWEAQSAMFRQHQLQKLHAEFRNLPQEKKKKMINKENFWFS